MALGKDIILLEGWSQNPLKEIKLELSFVGSVAGNQKKKGVKDIPGRRERICNDGGHAIACYL